MYSSIATRSGLEMLYRRLRGNVDPGNRSMAQSYGRCGGSERALCLQNTSEISWYSAGIDDRSSRSGSGFWRVTEEGRADCKQLARQVELQLWTLADLQSMWGLCLVNQECPKTNGINGESITKKEISSKWLPDSWSWTGQVRVVTRASSLPSSVLASSGSLSCSVVNPSCLTNVVSKKLSSAPQSMSAWSSRVWFLQQIMACNWVRGREDRGRVARLARMLPPASEPSGLTVGLDSGRCNDLVVHSRGRRCFLFVVLVYQYWDGSDPAAWAPPPGTPLAARAPAEVQDEVKVWILPELGSNLFGEGWRHWQGCVVSAVVSPDSDCLYELSTQWDYPDSQVQGVSPVHPLIFHLNHW